MRESLQKGEAPARVSEKARGEFIVAPILIECRDRVKPGINIFSGITLEADKENGLYGECDFILARSASRYALQSPLMLILEAKKHDIDEELPQCAAQMLAALRYNEQDGKPLRWLYGCVTNRVSWHFLKLHGIDLQLHPERFAIDEVSKILWVLVESLKDVDQQASHAA
ncbi:MAG: hypothetical protein FJX66_15985 [Alphaproteobacteria bacterium]|nr:hypothetical protein [Alphaproteobacteria bacterium]